MSAFKPRRETQTFLVTVSMDKPLWKSRVADMLRRHLMHASTYFGPPGSMQSYKASKITVRPVKEKT